MGQVFEAERIDQPGQRVAVKTLLDSRGTSSGADARRILDEALIGSQLDHPNIVRTLDMGRDGDRVYLVMELLEGHTLATLCPMPGEPLPEGAVVGLALQVLDGLAHAHQIPGLVHRDVKPSNLFVTHTGVVKLIDFGIAVADAIDATSTLTGMIRGSVPFMSPEHVEGKPIDGRSDLYSLALTMHELLTGRRVFEQKLQAQLVSAILFSTIAPIRMSRPEVSAALEDTVSWALAKNPEGRPPNAQAWAEQLKKSVPLEQIWTPAQLSKWAAKRGAEIASLRAVSTASQSIQLPPTTDESREASLAPAARLSPVKRWAAAGGVAAALLVIFLAYALGARQSAPDPVVQKVTPGAAAVPSTPPAVPPEALPAPVVPVVTRPLPVEPVAPRPADKNPGAVKKPAGTGWLTVDAQPIWARVTIDGKPVGPTPVYRYKIGSGKHRVEASTDDGRRQTRSVVVPNDREAKVIFEW
jgi:serine/threonine-protein kinase